jgi:small subunit ribosomal protein S1
MKKVDHLREGQLVEGKITHLTKFGAFASLGEDLEGLIHISELSEQRIAHPKEVVKEGDSVTLRIIKIDPERRRIGLSLRKVDSPAYADLDWKMALAGEVKEAQETKQPEESGEPEPLETVEPDAVEPDAVEPEPPAEE